MQVSFSSNSITDDHIATKFGTCHDSPAVVPCAKYCSDHFISIWMRAKWNFHHIWIVMEKSLVKWVPDLKSRVLWIFPSHWLHHSDVDFCPRLAGTVGMMASQNGCKVIAVIVWGFMGSFLIWLKHSVPVIIGVSYCQGTVMHRIVVYKLNILDQCMKAYKDIYYQTDRDRKRDRNRKKVLSRTTCWPYCRLWVHWMQTLTSCLGTHFIKSDAAVYKHHPEN